MKRIAVVTLLFFTAFVSLVFAQKSGSENNSAMRRKIAELNRNFTYQGKPINPLAIQDLVAWAADPLPGPIAVDVGGTIDSNRYYGDYEVRKNGFVYIDVPVDEDTKGWFGYEHLGRLANGLHVLHTYYNSGGTGIFESVLLVECFADFEYREKGRRRQLLIIKRRAEFKMGEGDSGEVTVKPKENVVIIGNDKLVRKKPRRITIGKRN